MKCCVLLGFLTMLSFSVLSKDIPWQEALMRGDTRSGIGLPSFCGGKSDGIDWQKKFGSDMNWLNHYCYGKVKTPICNRYAGQSRKKCFNYILSEYSYPLTRVTPQFKLLPFLHVEYGRALIDAEQYGQAIVNFTIALKKNAKYISAFKGLADAYVKLKMYDDAEKIVMQGLQIKKSQSLMRRLKKIQQLKLTKK